MRAPARIAILRWVYVVVVLSAGVGGFGLGEPRALLLLVLLLRTRAWLPSLLRTCCALQRPRTAYRDAYLELEHLDVWTLMNAETEGRFHSVRLEGPGVFVQLIYGLDTPQEQRPPLTSELLDGMRDLWWLREVRPIERWVGGELAQGHSALGYGLRDAAQLEVLAAPCGRAGGVLVISTYRDVSLPEAAITSCLETIALRDR